MIKDLFMVFMVNSIYLFAGIGFATVLNLLVYLIKRHKSSSAPKEVNNHE